MDAITLSRTVGPPPESGDFPAVIAVQPTTNLGFTYIFSIHFQLFFSQRKSLSTFI